MGFAGFDQMLQHRTFMPPERHHNGEDALHEALWPEPSLPEFGL